MSAGYLRMGFVAVVWSVVSVRSSTAAPPEAGELLGRLTRDCGFLFSDEERRTLDAINRQYREAIGNERRAKNDGERNAARERQDAAVRQMTDLLEKTRRALRVTIKGDELIPADAGTINLPGDVGAILLRIESGAGEPRFAAVAVDFGVPEPVVTVPTGAGVTWAVAAVTSVPEKRTRATIRLAREGRPALKWPVELVTPRMARLKLRVLSDGKQPTPAMVRLSWKTGGGRDIRPVNALDIDAQFDAQGRPTSQRWPNLPGLMSGGFWCLPEALDMPVPPGEYTLVVRRGAEHIPIQAEFTVPPGEIVEKTYTIERWVDMRDHGWYSGDDHVHARMLDAGDADRLMAWLKAEDLHLANIVKMGDIYRTWFEQRGFGKGARVIDGDYVLSPGQECPRTHEQIGHTLAMNITSMVRDTDKYYSYDWVAKTVHEQGGLWGYAHLSGGAFFVHRDATMNIAAGNVDFAEVLQFGQLGTNLYYDFLNLGFKLTASAGSDVPWGGTVGEVRVYARPEGRFDADTWFDAVRRGRTFVSNGPMIDFRVEEAYPGDELVVEAERKLKVKARAWGDPGRMLPLKLEIIRHGETIKTAESAEGRKEIAVEFDLDAGDGFWLAAKVEAGDGTRAHTTPVYVVRKGLRFWKYAAVDELIAKRLVSLDEVAGIVQAAKETVAKSKAETPAARMDLAIEQLVVQGDALLTRVEQARKAYAGLKAIAAREKAVRGGTSDTGKG